MSWQDDAMAEQEIADALFEMGGEQSGEICTLITKIDKAHIL